MKLTFVLAAFRNILRCSLNNMGEADAINLRVPHMAAVVGWYMAKFDYMQS